MDFASKLKAHAFFKIFSLTCLVVLSTMLFGCRDNKNNSSSTPSGATRADLIVFTPTNTFVNNPTSSTLKKTLSAPQSFTISMTMLNSQGQPLVPSASNPVHVAVYGAPDGVIWPTSTTSSTGVVTFFYNGQYFPNNIMIDAWISDSTNNGAAIGQTQVLQQNAPPCTYAPVSYNVPLAASLPDDLEVSADVGYSADSPPNTLTPYDIDTGSLGVIVPTSALPPPGPNLIGPGPAGSQLYSSSGLTFYGNYYLATVRIKTSTGTIITPPILVLAVNPSSFACTGPASKPCHHGYRPNLDSGLFYMGVGFGRPGAGNASDLFHSPTANAFLHITDANNGTDISPGYALTPSDSSAQTPNGITLGVSSTHNYSMFNLTPNSAYPGDFQTPYGCISFPGSSSPTPICGTVLLDAGIQYMIFTAPKALLPPEVESAGLLRTNTPTTVTAGTANQLNYNFSVVDDACPPYPTGSNNVAPCHAEYDDTTSDGGAIFINTGRRPLYQWDYVYHKF
jgi:hypothetical protein